MEFWRRRGTIKLYDPKKKFGFVTDYVNMGDTANTIEERDVFFHISEFKYRAVPQVGQHVEYRLIKQDNKVKAVDLVLLIATTESQKNEVMKILRSSKHKVTTPK